MDYYVGAGGEASLVPSTRNHQQSDRQLSEVSAGSSGESENSYDDRRVGTHKTGISRNVLGRLVSWIRDFSIHEMILC